MNHGDFEERLRALELTINGIQRDAENHQHWADARSTKMDQIDKTLQELRMEIHGAKIGGRVALGIALTMGSLLGWIASLLKDHMVKMLLVGSLVFLASCAQLTPEQQAELATLRQQNVAAMQKGQELTAELEQARKDFAAGKLTQEKLTDLTLRTQEGIDAARRAYEETAKKMADLQKQGVPPWQTLWDGGLGQIAISLAGAWLLAKQGDKGAVQAALAKVREERGPIDARKGSAPRAT